MHEKIEKIAVINLLGTTELFMALPLLKSIKKANPYSYITLLMNKKYGDMRDLFPYVDEFVYFDRKEISNRLNDAKYSLVDNYDYIKEHLKAILDTYYDLVINITNNRIGGIITSMLNTDAVKGLTFDEYGNKWIEDPWFTYLNDVVSIKHLNTFHFVDLFQHGGGYYPLKIKHGKQDIDRYKSDAEGNIAVYIMEDSKENIKELSRKLITDLNNILKNFEIHEIRCRYSELPEYLDKYSTFVSMDSTASFIASINGKKVIYLSPDDTRHVTHGPYGNDHIVVNTRLEDEGINYSAEVISSLFLDQRTCPENSRYSVWISRFDRDGFAEYVPYIPVDFSENEFYKWVYKAMWKCTLGKRVQAGDPRRFLSMGEKYIDRVVDFDKQVDYIINDICSRYKKDTVKRTIEHLERGSKEIENIKNMAFKGIRSAKRFLATVSIPGNELSSIKDAKKEIGHIDEAVFKMEDRELISSLVRVFRSAREELHVRNLFPLAKNIILTYEDLFSKSSFLEEISNGVQKNMRGN